jgi:hypothetical protein
MNKWTSGQAAFHSYQEVHGPPGRRRSRRNIAEGEGMLVAERDFTFQGERYRAGVSRVAPDAAIAQSEYARWLVPAYSKEAGLPVLQWLERQLHQRTGGRRCRTTSGRDYWRLSDRPSSSQGWRLT